MLRLGRLPTILLVLSFSTASSQQRQRVEPLGPVSGTQDSVTSPFELDGNAVGGSGEDWQLLNGGGGSAVAFTTVVPDPGQSTIFAGGPKDIQDITEWTWKSNGGFPDKNDITNAYAAAYMIGGDLVVYFGADRFANTGDAYLGFWFFKDRVTRLQNGTFSGRHQIGDLLVLVNYPQGAGATPEVQVIEWNPALQDVGQNLHLLFKGAAALCGMVPPATACAITNSSGEPAPWPYVPKSGAAGTFPRESFFEGGVNLSEILGGSSCFSSFMAETRSSTSITATLKDFVVSEFPVCDISVSKACEVVRFSPDFSSFVVSFTATVSNDGAGTFPAGSIVAIVDDAGTPGDLGDDVAVTDTLTDPLVPGGEVTLSGEFESDQNPPFNTVTASITTEETVVRSESFGIECSPLPLNPRLALSKLCSLALESVGGMLVVRVDFTGDVRNTGDVPLFVTVTDDMAGVVLPEQRIDPGQTILLSGSYYPGQANGGVTDPGTAMFSDTFTARGTNPILEEPVVERITANCGLCP